MSFSDLSLLGSGAKQPGTDSPPPRITRAIVATPPANVDDGMVIVPIGQAAEWPDTVKPYHWMPKGATMPAKGAMCMVMFDQHNDPWVVGWEGPASSTMPPTPTDLYGLRAQTLLTGGGNITWDSSFNLHWDARFLVIEGGHGADSASDGWFEIGLPTAGYNIPIVNGGTVTCVAGGAIPLSGWRALYYILPIGQGYVFQVANLRIVDLTPGMEPPPSNWVMLATVNWDTDTHLRLGNGSKIKPGETVAASRSGPADGAAGTATLRTLGTGAQQAAAGNDSRFQVPRIPARRFRVAALSLPANAWTDVPLDGTSAPWSFDTVSAFNSAGHFIVPGTGVYTFKGHLSFSSPGAGNTIGIAFYNNTTGTYHSAQQRTTEVPAGGVESMIQTDDLTLSAGQEIRLAAWTSAAASLNNLNTGYYNWLSVQRVT